MQEKKLVVPSRSRPSFMGGATGRTARKAAALLGIGIVGVALLLAGPTPASADLLDPTSIPKYVDPLVIPPPMPITSVIKQKRGRNIDYYEIAVREFNQQILPSPMPATTVWSYGSVNHPGTFNYPAFTIEARADRAVRVKWINDLVDGNGDYLSHLLPVDQTLHWANPPGGVGNTDMRPEWEDTPEPYLGPVPIVTHVHGAHTADDSDGYTEAWYLPDANDIPGGYATVGTYYDIFKGQSPIGNLWGPGNAVFEYPNDQRATTLWYHDHSLGMTRLNVYAGPAGFWIIRGGPHDLPAGPLPAPAPKPKDNPNSKKNYYEIPIVVQDRTFYEDGSLFYPSSREFFDGYTGPFIPDTDLSPIWNPEFFGDTMVTNGNTWPVLNVEPRRYRFRFLNGCNSRFLSLKMVSDPLEERPATAALNFWQIGADGGFLPAPVELDQLLMGLAERADVIVDFTGLAVGTEVFLINEGPDDPFGGGVVGVDFDAADPNTTGQVMKFVVGPLLSTDTSTPPAALVLPALTPLGTETVVRRLSLNEEMSTVWDGPAAALLGVLDSGGNPVSLLWMDPITEDPTVGSTEVWEFYNFTADAHPIHLHLVEFEVVDRQALETEDGETLVPATLVGSSIPPEPWETGTKDTVISYPGQVTRVKAMFDLVGLYVWHCHIIEHEDNEMMRPFVVVP
ncbi:MAG: multicopper oxidase [Anaerolineae bacterium]|nr:multicopper oxidase [Anaerolineae bacterium]